MIWREARYRETVEDGAGPWVTLPRVPDGARHLEVRGLVRGHTYEVAVRLVDDERARTTAWVTAGAWTVGYAEDPAPAVRNPRVVCGRELTWDAAVPGDPGARRFHVYHAPSPWEHYQDAVRATDEPVGPPPLDLCLIPKGDRTICIVPVDNEGQEGVPEYLPTDRGPFDDVEAVIGRTESHSGAFGSSALTIANGTIGGSEITQDAYAGAVAAQPFYIGPGSQKFFRGVGSAVFYATAYKEMTVEIHHLSGSENDDFDPLVDGAVVTLGITSTDSGNWRAEWRPRPGAFYFGDGTQRFYRGGPPAGPAHGDGKFWHGVDGGSRFYGSADDDFYTGGDLDPFWDIHPWLPWPGRLGALGSRVVDFRFVFPPRATTPAKIQGLTVHESFPPRPGADVPALDGNHLIDADDLPGGLLPAGEVFQSGTAQVTATPGPTTVTFPAAFTAIPHVGVGIEDMGGDEFAWQFVRGSISKTRFQVRIYDAAGAEVFTGRIHWSARGA